MAALQQHISVAMRVGRGWFEARQRIKIMIIIDQSVVDASHTYLLLVRLDRFQVSAVSQLTVIVFFFQRSYEYNYFLFYNNNNTSLW